LDEAEVEDLEGRLDEMTARLAPTAHGGHRRHVRHLRDRGGQSEADVADEDERAVGAIVA
jgi:hypothetical protein